MNSSQIKCSLVFTLFAVIGFGPVSPGCLIGMYIVLKRPEWFLHLVGNLYDNPSATEDSLTDQQVLSLRVRVFLSLLLLFTIDILPVPVTPAIAFVIILGRPFWFYRMVRNIYSLTA